MSQEDRQRWDQKWSGLTGKPFVPHPMLATNKALLPGGRALDLACGMGQNSIWLASHGYQVMGIDISGEALRAALAQATQRDIADQIVFAQMDLDLWSLPLQAFDLICVFRFLNRRLFPGIRTGLKSGGLLLYCTRHMGILDRHPDAHQDYLLQPNELFNEFSDWRILHYAEGSDNAEIIAQKK